MIYYYITLPARSTQRRYRNVEIGWRSIPEDLERIEVSRNPTASFPIDRKVGVFYIQNCKTMYLHMVVTAYVWGAGNNSSVKPRRKWTSPDFSLFFLWELIFNENQITAEIRKVHPFNIAFHTPIKENNWLIWKIIRLFSIDNWNRHYS